MVLLINTIFEFCDLPFRVFLYVWSRAFSISADLMILQALSPKEQQTSQTSGMRDVRCGLFQKTNEEAISSLYLCCLVELMTCGVNMDNTHALW